MERKSGVAKLDLIAFDADDTLWHNERLYVQAQQRFAALLANYHPAEWIHERLYQAEMRNIHHFGYGIKSFVLSMIETAVELTEGRVSGADIQTLVNEARRMISAPVELLPRIDEVIPLLAKTHPLMIITKGDQFEQDGKVARCGIRQHFTHVEIVSQKNPESYAALFRKYGFDPASVLMVGNSLRSDILPVLELGGRAVYIPYETTWLHEIAEQPEHTRPGFYQLEHAGQLPDLIERIRSGEACRLNGEEHG